MCSISYPVTLLDLVKVIALSMFWTNWIECACSPRILAYSSLLRTWYQQVVTTIVPWVTSTHVCQISDSFWGLHFNKWYILEIRFHQLISMISCSMAIVCEAMFHFFSCDKASKFVIAQWASSSLPTIIWLTSYATLL